MGKVVLHTSATSPARFQGLKWYSLFCQASEAGRTVGFQPALTQWTHVPHVPGTWYKYALGAAMMVCTPTVAPITYCTWY